ncbi:uncharacterized protein B0T15DRAFT_535220 [Chaetomium strumarium]|uniref:Septation initiation network scaffold protein cdc11 n=1 Tax=Chaetomium strumarium TaxID=1170767 RepID=A0AAJ0GPZ7_9PEZI|nr:hypothetical protein B0T15DRAFT_535220 [Chaetomium strumarium]
MGHAWLDSLSEDWVSQPGSPANDGSFAEAATPSPATKPLPKPKTPSRIPRFSPHHKKYQNSIDGSSSNGGKVLGERSLNERLAALSRPTPSKLSQEISPSGRDCHACRSASASATNSVVRRTFLRKSTGASQDKGKEGETPEWKRRLVYGDLSYGEQRDLFTSAGTGLENIFKPPQQTPGPSRGGDVDASSQVEEPQVDAAMPSSPPLYQRDPSTVDIHVDGPMEEQELPQQPQRQGPAGMRYRRSEESPDASRLSDAGMPPSGRSQGGTQADQTALSEDVESRRVSGRSDLRHEDFSPILLERREASNGKTIYGPADLPPDELRKRLETLQLSQKYLTGGADEGSVRVNTASRNEGAGESYGRLEAFINFQRGGRSNEGSFRNRVLSSALSDSSELHPEESLQASTPKQFPTVRVERWDSSENSPDLPRAPDPSPDKGLAPPQPGNNSPLKLFQPYDTFTSQTLMRRLSQMHGEFGDISFSIAVDGNSPYLAATPSWLLPPPTASASGSRDQHSSNPNWFGVGELDGYEFNEEFSHIPNDLSAMDGDKENRGPREDSMSPPRPPIFDVSHNSSPSSAADVVVHRRRQKSTASHTSRRPGRASFPAYSDLLSTPGRQRDASGSEIKRPRTSPSKDHPTPKRRRTLHKSDVSYGVDDFDSAVDSVQLSHQQMQSALSMSRQDARSSDRYDMQEAVAPATGQAVRPRTPTPSQRSSLQRERQPLAEIERSPARSSRHGQPPAPLPVGSARETNRKVSIKTEDFINEANKIMAMIRSKAGLPSGLASVEESDEEKVQGSPELDGSFEDSTQEPFDRPPSREGRPPLTRRSTKQEDPILAEQLKKYKEASDMGDMITSSVRSNKLAQEVNHAAEEQESGAWPSRRSRHSASGAGTVSDLPKVRISQNTDWQEHPSTNGVDDSVPSQGSASFPTQSTGMSMPTGSSRGSSRGSGSDARKTIMPESVSHLIPDQIGSMVLDRQRNVWVRRKGSEESRRSRSFSQSVASEDDPFAGIPDLTVDVTREMQNLKLAAKKQFELQDRLPGAAEISPTRAPRVGSATRTTPDASPESLTHINYANHPSNAEETGEHEPSGDSSPANEPRRLTISFSSPVASVIQDVAGINDTGMEGNNRDQAAEMLYRDAPARDRRNISIQARSRSASRGPTRYLSVKGRPLMGRPVSRIEERDEESSPNRSQDQEPTSGMELSVLGDYSVVSREHGRRQASLSFLVAAPAQGQNCPAAGVDQAAVISQYVGTFSLSPLSEFTIHCGEDTLPLEASYVVDNHRLVTGDPSRRVMSMSMRELVDKLAEVEPFEPYWEDMRELELRDKGLSSLHTLDQFCGKLQSLDASKNKIRNLGGVPSSVLRLRMTDNQLSSLTAWNHLMNLQYVDVSNNGLTSLSAFKSLIHLRSLRADNNQITSLDGIKFHKGLQMLRVRGNLMEEVDFDGSTLHQLTELDLKGNRISQLAHVGQLPALNSLNLEANQLSTFSVESDEPMHSLRYLRLDDNKLTFLNVQKLPHLRLLHADRNCLVQISGFSRARRIDSLSLREQRGTAPLNLAHLLSRAYEVRKLYLSGNLLGSFCPTIDLLNLQLLELANCGLSALPEEVGLMMPNLRVLNLNMNALADLAPLRCVPRLKKLFAVGNRLADPAKVVNTLAGFQHLVVVDLRDNPVTQGFYASVLQQVRVVLRSKVGGGGGKGGDDGEEGEEEVGEAEEEEQFMLADQDPRRDEKYCARLDMDTRVKRRLYETMVGKRCARVKKLDGLSLKRGVKGGAEDERDVVWLAMAEKGLVNAVDEKVDAGKGNKAVERCSRWPAEDSFA